MVQELFLAKGSDLGPGMVAVRTVIVFAFALIFVRMAKKRFIAQATAMDLVVAVILGSTLSRGINGGANLLSTLIAGFMIVVVNRVLAHFSARSHKFGRLVKGSKEVLLRDGVIDEEQMSKHDITEEDLHQEMRVRALVDDVAKLKLAVLERSGEIGFIKAEES